VTPYDSQLKAQFDNDGFIQIGGFLSPEEAGEVDENILRFIDEVLPKAPENTAFYENQDDPDTIKRLQNMARLDGYFEAMFESDRFTELARFLLADDVVPRDPQWFNKPARVGAVTPPHQDGFYFMLEPNEAVTLWIALDHIGEDNGCMRYVRGSHRRGMRPHQMSNVLGFSQGISDYSDADRQLEAPMLARPGDLFAHHSMIIHRADVNHSPRRRSALGLVYFAASASQDKERAERYRRELFSKWEQEGKIKQG